MTAYTLIRTNRKTVGIRITEAGVVEVRAPQNLSKSEIDKIVETKRAWIDAHIASRTAHARQKAMFALSYGDTVLYLGKVYPIAIKPGNRIGFDGTAFYVPDGLSPDEIKHAVIQIYRLLAKRELSTRVTTYAKRMNVSPTSVKINAAKTRWGSCSTRNSLNFSWWLILADEDVVDYVVVHELAHIREHNHSTRFWAIIEGVLPDYKARQRRLKELQARLSNEDWIEVMRHDYTAGISRPHQHNRRRPNHLRQTCREDAQKTRPRGFTPFRECPWRLGRHAHHHEDYPSQDLAPEIHDRHPGDHCIATRGDRNHTVAAVSMKGLTHRYAP